ncbi:MAG TPA: DinB family protein [Cytophagales bacterium]|nr:DinB family protein [Cytophagales bacterium]
MNRPPHTEYTPYFQKYFDLVPDIDIFEYLRDNTIQTLAFFKNIPDDKLNYTYAPDKWTIKEIWLHIVQVEKSLLKLLVVTSKNTSTPVLDIHGLFELPNSTIDSSMEQLSNEFQAVRASAQNMFENFSEVQAQLILNFKGHSATARSLAYIFTGHAIHHMNMIQEKYLMKLA